MPEGIIYVLTNEAMSGYVKIGKTSTSVAQRIRELDGTSLPFPFECFHAARVTDMDSAEKYLHDAFADSRVTHRREFFLIDPERVRSAMKLAEIEDVTPREDELVENSEDRAAIERSRSRRINSSFLAMGIAPGECLTFDKDAEIACVVHDDKRVLFEGDVMGLSRAALIVVSRMGYDWSSVNGWSYWCYKGQKLDELRKEMEATS